MEGLTLLTRSAEKLRFSFRYLEGKPLLNLTRCRQRSCRLSCNVQAEGVAFSVPNHNHHTQNYDVQHFFKTHAWQIEDLPLFIGWWKCGLHGTYHDFACGGAQFYELANARMKLVWLKK